MIGKCEHTAVVCTYVNDATDDSRASRLQQWGKPSKKPVRGETKTMSVVPRLPTLMLTKSAVSSTKHTTGR